MHLFTFSFILFTFFICLLSGASSDIRCNVETNFIMCYLQTTTGDQFTSLSVFNCDEDTFNSNSEFRRISPISLGDLKSTTFPEVILISFIDSGVRKLNPDLFQQQTKLKQIWAQNEPFHCNCDLQWAAIASNVFDWSITGTCSTPNALNGREVTDISNYLGCPQTQSFQCFNKSFICPTNSICINNVDNAYCECIDGHFLFDNECHVDVDCEINNGTCDYLCSHTNGTDHCVCREGFSVYGDRRSCLDINECTEELDNCQQLCVNTFGSYDCECQTGFQQHSGTCMDIDECLAGTHTCQHFCFNTKGSYLCECQQGLILSATGICVDTDECLYDNGGCDYKCTNNNGSYQCSCMQGYELKDDGKTCQDIDECYNGINRCENLCINTNGSFSCLSPGVSDYTKLIPVFVFLLLIIVVLVIIIFVISIFLFKYRRNKQKDKQEIPHQINIPEDNLYNLVLPFQANEQENPFNNPEIPRSPTPEHTLTENIDHVYQTL